MFTNLANELGPHPAVSPGMISSPAPNARLPGCRAAVTMGLHLRWRFGAAKN